MIMVNNLASTPQIDLFLSRNRAGVWGATVRLTSFPGKMKDPAKEVSFRYVSDNRLSLREKTGCQQSTQRTSSFLCIQPSTKDHLGGFQEIPLSFLWSK